MCILVSGFVLSGLAGPASFLTPVGFHHLMLTDLLASKDFEFCRSRAVHDQSHAISLKADLIEVVELEELLP